MTVSAIDKGPLSAMVLGLQERLQLAFPPNVFDFQIMPARLTAGAWSRVTRRLPFVGLGWNMAKSSTGARFSGAAHFSLFLVTRNSTGEMGRLLGDQQGPGILQLVTAAVAVLGGFKIPDLSDGAAPGATVGTCVVTMAANASAELASEDMAVATIDFEVQGLLLTVASVLQGTEATPDALKMIGESWAFTTTSDEIVLSDSAPFGAPT
jgi:hypothetical protein